jgi:HK97 family phage major capsid protein
MADVVKELLEGIKKNTDNLRSELDALKGANFLEDPLVKAKIDAYDNEFKTLKDQYEAEKKAREELDLKLQRANFAPGQENQDPEAKARTSGFEKYVRYGAKAQYTEQEQKALSSLVDVDGGYFLPADVESGILKIAQDEAEIRGVANVGTTSRDRVQGGKITQRATIAWGSEGIAVDPQDLKAGLEDMPINEITALVLVPNNTLEDAAADIFGEITALFGEDIAKAEDDAFVIGDGVLKPEGILSNKKVQARAKNSKVAAALTDANNNGLDVLIDALYSLKKTYRRNGVWAFNSLTEATVRKIKDTTGQYLWQPPVQAGAPATLHGYRIINPEGMPDIAANSFPILFGDFRRGYKIRDRKGMSVQRLMERYAEYRMTGFLVTKRVGGQVQMDEAFVPIKIST